MSRAKFALGRVWYALALLVCGILLIVGGVDGANAIMEFLVTAIGVVSIVMGIVGLFSHQIFMGILMIVMGIGMISCAWTIAWVAFLLIGAMMLVSGFFGFFRGVGFFTSLANVLVGVSILLIGFGNRFAWNCANIFFYVSGAMLVVDSVLVLFKA